MSSANKALVGLGTLVVLGSLAILAPTFLSKDALPRLHPGLDIQGGTTWVYRIEVPDDVDTTLAQQQAVMVVRNRLEYVEVDAIVTSRTGHIVVQLPGANEEEMSRVSDVVTVQARFEMRMIDEGSRVVDELQLPEGVQRHVENHGSGPRSYLVAGSREALEQLGRSELRFGLVGQWEESFDPRLERWRSYAVQDARITGEDITDAYVATDDVNPAPSVLVTFGTRGASVLEEITTGGVGSRLAILLDDEVLSAPVVSSPIPGGVAQIRLGHRDTVDQILADAQDLAVTLRAGALPSALVLESENVVEPTQPELALSIPLFTIVLLIIVAVAGMRRPKGATFALPLLVFLSSFATLALWGAVANIALLAGVSTTVALILVSTAVALRRFQQTLPKTSRMLITAAPSALCFVLLLAGGATWGVGQGPVRAFGFALVATSLVGLPLSAVWMFLSLHIGEGSNDPAHE